MSLFALITNSRTIMKSMVSLAKSGSGVSSSSHVGLVINFLDTFLFRFRYGFYNILFGYCHLGGMDLGMVGH